MTSSKEATASYVELSNQTYKLFIDALASANQRALEYTKSVWEISSRPYETAAFEAILRDGFERANKIVEAGIATLQANGRTSAELAENLVAQNAKLQESFTTGFKGLLETAISNLNYVAETASAQFEGFSKRMEDLRGSTVSAH